MNRFGKTILFLFSIAVVVIVGIIGFRIHAAGSSSGGILPTAQAVTCNDWNLISSPSPGNTENTLSAIAAVSASDVWAAGVAKSSGGGWALFEHWDGSSWKVVPAPATGFIGDEMHGLAAVSTNDVWAVGTTYDFKTNSYRTLIEHWDGAKWTVVTGAKTAMRDNNLNAIAAISPRDIWAVGLSFSGVQNQPRQTLIEHWDGSQWSLVKSVNPGGSDSVLSSVTAVSADDVWAVGSTQSGPLIEHWNGKSWSVVAGASSGSLNAVAALSRNDVWAVGQAYNPDTGERALVEHWNGKAWSLMPITDPESKMDWLNNISAISANNIWVVGEFKDYNTRLFRTFALHWDGGRWGLSQWPWRYGQANGSDSFGVKAVVAIDKQHIWSVGSMDSITQNPPIDNPPINGATQTLTLFRC